MLHFVCTVTFLLCESCSLFDSLPLHGTIFLLHSQDGNSLAAWFGVVTSGADAASANRTASISAYLEGNWNEFGATSPEWGGMIGTFPGSMEVYAHFAANEGARALDLVRLMWGYMINSPTSTESTFWEGYKSDGTFDFRGR